jgi:hypothetical protein
VSHLLVNCHPNCPPILEGLNLQTGPTLRAADLVDSDSIPGHRSHVCLGDELVGQTQTTVGTVDGVAVLLPSSAAVAWVPECSSGGHLAAVAGDNAADTVRLGLDHLQREVQATEHLTVIVGDSPKHLVSSHIALLLEKQLREIYLMDCRN